MQRLLQCSLGFNRLQGLSLALLVCIALSSCAKAILSMAGVFDEQVTLQKIASPGKQIIFIPMHHVGKPAFYADVKRKVDSLHRLGYVLYYEQVIAGPSLNAAAKDTLKRKLRKLIGYLNPEGYISKDGKLMGYSFGFVKELMNQPIDHTIGIDSSKDQRVDMYAEDLMARYEKEFGSISLNECDFSTSFDSTYRCGKIQNKKARILSILHWRNDYIVHQILQSTDQKIMLMYGSKHYDGIAASLKETNSQKAARPQ